MIIMKSAALIPSNSVPFDQYIHFFLSYFKWLFKNVTVIYGYLFHFNKNTITNKVHSKDEYSTFPVSLISEEEIVSIFTCKRVIQNIRDDTMHLYHGLNSFIAYYLDSFKNYLANCVLIY